MIRPPNFLPVLLLLLLVSATFSKHETKEDMGTVVGIDLGTTYSCVGVYRYGRVEIIPNEQGSRITPSYVAFTPEGERLIGDAAKSQLTINPKNTVFDVKRLIGRTWDDPSVQHDIQFYPFKVIEWNGKPRIVVTVEGENKLFAAEEISGMVLFKMKQIAEDYLGRNVTHAVVTVPAYFNDAQRQATKNAGIIAGLNVVRIISEPTAAALAYGMDQKEGEKTIMVFDLGGGTFDVTLLSIENGVFQVLATNGDTHLGGEDFDQRVMDYFIKLFKKKNGKDIRNDNRAVQKLRREVEKAKRALSNENSARIEIDSFFEGDDFSEVLTRAKFEELNMDLFRLTLNPVENVLKDSDMEKEDIEEIVLVGGSTRIPKVQQLVREFFTGLEPNTGMNPDEAVAYGAAVQAGVIGGEKTKQNMLLYDVCPLSLGINTESGVMSTFISRNTPIPTKRSQIVTTVVDDQDYVTIRVYEGERPMSKDNHFLGKFRLDVPPAPRGVPEIKVTFEIDVNGILWVTGEEQSTGNREKIEINSEQSRLKPEEIQQMVDEAMKFAEADKQVKERAEARNEFESYAYSIRSQLKGLSGRINKEDSKTIDDAVTKAINWLEKYTHLTAKQMITHKNRLQRVVDPLISKYQHPGGAGRRSTYSPPQHEDL